MRLRPENISPWGGGASAGVSLRGLIYDRGRSINLVKGDRASHEMLYWYCL
ncbi:MULTISPECIES: hypothetical protein [unclassified Microcoleus]|uniref:hypothetical protein n=1 Tax=unclassified Microcoleus TaxID=2642155 RepID=UPI001DAEC4E6|nr:MULTISPECIES: hypothetical protein [unclassified Microcoleus]MCC3461523.1 hypothetical protein [Microcoleus sp. PH2017_11_PCY_U_A]MCC3479997.1 hypothetical protein [Microcoleus sp. PH2017_12_PCY_D_A]MCC3529803.1 hypothetical protein [Microcoleus sp. PH2017_21_RUC_O_A]MCC3542023.1 hypothetical protein [Microcoleus sp. PH2017_22_RUC_O_B]